MYRIFGNHHAIATHLLLGSSRSLVDALLECKQLLRPERLVVDLSSRLDKVLQVCPCKEVAEVHEFTVVGIFNVNHSPAVLAPANRLARYDHVVFRANNSERNDFTDRLVKLNLFLVIFISVKRIQANVVVHQLFPNLGLEPLPLLQRQAVTLRNNRHNIDDLAQLLHHDHVNRPQGMAGGVDEVQTAVDARVLDVSVTHSRQFLAQVRAVLVFDVFNDSIPASLVVDLVSVTWSINDIEPKLDTVLNNDMGNSLNLRCLPDGLVRGKTTLRVNEVRGENSVDERRLAQTSLTNDNDVELEPTLQELVFNLLRNTVKTDIGLRADFFC